MKPVVVLGAGPAGVGAALMLAKSGKAPVKVLERVGNEVILSAPELLERIVDYPTSALVEGTKITASR